jgi:hypothetical protein
MHWYRKVNLHKKNKDTLCTNRLPPLKKLRATLSSNDRIYLPHLSRMFVKICLQNLQKPVPLGSQRNSVVQKKQIRGSGHKAC